METLQQALPESEQVSLESVDLWKNLNNYDLNDLQDYRDQLCYQMIEAEGLKYELLSNQLDKVENLITYFERTEANG